MRSATPVVAVGVGRLAAAFAVVAVARVWRLVVAVVAGRAAEGRQSEMAGRAAADRQFRREMAARVDRGRPFLRAIAARLEDPLLAGSQMVTVNGACVPAAMAGIAGMFGRTGALRMAW